MKIYKKIIAILLALMLSLSPLAITVFAADGEFKVKMQNTLSKGIDAVLNGVLGAVASVIPDGDNTFDASEYVSENFIEGNKSFLDEPAANAVWRLGSTSVSLVPDDYLEKDYYLGGYLMLENGFNNHVEEIVDDMMARVIAVDDGTDRGVAVFATIDCIGITNKDIREIRELVMDKSNGKYTFSGISVSATHAHSGIDTEGLWTNTVSKIFKNLFKSLFHIGELETGTDAEFMAMLRERVACAMIEACDKLEPGTMTYATKDISGEYFVNKNRASASSLISDLNRFVFTPSDEESTPTMIVNIAAHPDVAGLPTSDGQSTGRQLTGDYIYYIGEMLGEAGYNCMFFNGAIAGIYMARGASNDGQNFTARYQQSQRYGREIGKIALAMTMTEAEIDQNELLADKETVASEKAFAGEGYSLWYEDWQPVTEQSVEPIFNIRFKQVRILVTNPLIKLLGKLNMASYDVLKKDGEYYLTTEIGYMEMGKQVKVALMPGEVCQDLVAGGASLEAETSFTGTAFSEKTLAEIFGEDVIVFGLTNDAIGYVIPDNDYCMCIAFDHYHELIATGNKTASSIMSAFSELADAVD